MNIVSIYCPPNVANIPDDILALHAALDKSTPTIPLGDWNPAYYQYDDLMAEVSWIEVSDRTVPTYVHEPTAPDRILISSDHMCNFLEDVEDDDDEDTQYKKLFPAQRLMTPLVSDHYALWWEISIAPYEQ